MVRWAYEPSFPGTLKALRQTCGLTLRAAGKAIGTSHVNVSRLETGHVPIGPLDFEFLARVARAYGVNTDQLRYAHGYRDDAGPEVDIRSLLVEQASRSSGDNDSGDLVARIEVTVRRVVREELRLWWGGQKG